MKFFLWIVLILILPLCARAQISVYTYTGGVQTYTVAPGVTTVSFDVRGARGGNSYYSLGTWAPSRGGYGGRVTGNLAVTPGQVLNVYVGGTPPDGIFIYGSISGPGGYNGGGNALAWEGAAGGGGASDIRTGGTALTNRIVVAGGGGGGGLYGYASTIVNYERGGDGGDTAGEHGFIRGGIAFSFYSSGGTLTSIDTAATGGTSTSGGRGGFFYFTTSGLGYLASSGDLGVGGNSHSSAYGGAGGGGGYYGGGGGSFSCGGGGGSSYADPTITTSVIHTQGYTTGDDTVIIGITCSGGTITGNPNMCIGGTTTLVDTVGASSGTWSSSNPAVATIGSLTGFVNGLSAGTAIITYSVTIYCGAVIATRVVTVYPYPTTISGVLAVCIGNNSTLSSTPTGGRWTSSNTAIATIGSVSGIVTSISAGTVVISYGVGTGVSCLTTTTVTVLPLPAPIAGPSVLCPGGTIVLTDASPGGTWASSSVGVAIIGSLTGIVTGINPGLSLITYTLPTGCITTKTITVNPLPAPISGPSSVCVGQSVSLSDLSTGGTWFSSNSLIASIGSLSGIVSGISAGTSIITYTLATGCLTTFTITVNPLPASITGLTSLCPGSNSVLTDITSGGSWLSSNTSIATIGSGTGLVTAITSGTSIISYILPTGCFTTITVLVYPDADPITGLTSICRGSVTTLTETSSGTWSSSSTAVATIGSLSGITTGISPGTSIITFTLPTGCIATTVVTILPLPSIITGIREVCEGANTTLYDSVSGGSWGSGSSATVYIDPTTGVVTGLSAGTSQITYILPTGCYITTTVTVNPGPAPITGTLRACVGYGSLLGDLSIGGTWSSGNTTIATIGSTSGLCNGISPGTSQITYTLATGCYATATFTVNNQPSPITGPTSVCVGSTINEFDAITGGSWTSSNTSIAVIGLFTGVVTGISLGTTIITYTLATGCLTTTTIAVTPSPAAISGLSIVCVGNSILLSDAISGGSWTSSNTGIAIVGTLSGTVIGIASGTCIITYSLGSGCNAYKTITVKPSPAPISGSSPLCVGQTTTYTDLTTGGLWSAIGTTVSIGSLSGLVTGISTGSAIITYALPSGCLVTRSLTITLSPSAISGPSSLCSGNTISLGNTVSGGIWSSTNTTAATIGSASGLLTGVSAGTTVISYTLAAGCYATKTITVYAAPAPISGPVAVCMGASITLSDATSGGYWLSSNPVVATIGSLTGSVTGLSLGTSIITYMLPSGCYVATTISVTPGPTAITGPSSVCIGFTILLIDGIAGGTWQSSNTTIATIDTISGLATGISSGTASITYSIGTGCTVFKTISVQALPASISGPDALCEGQSIALSDASAGGTWSSSSAIIGVGSTSGMVTGLSSGTASITYTLSTGCNVNKTLTVNPIPPPITGLYHVCLGQSTPLTNAITGGNWTSSNPTVATIGTSSGLLAGVSVGTVIITYSPGTGCIQTALIHVDALPSPIGGSTNLCLSTSTTLTNTTPGGTWTSSNTLVASVGSTTGLVTGLSIGTTIITYSLSTGCYATAIIAVSPGPTSISGIINLCAGSSTSLSSSTTGGTWVSGNTSVATIGYTTGNLLGIAPGTSTISYSLGGLCFVTQTVLINAIPPAILGLTHLCLGQFTTLSNTLTGGTWSSSNTSVATIDAAGLVHGLVPGTSIITYTLNTCPATTIFTVNPPPMPIIGNYGCLGTTTTLRDSTFGGTWSSFDTSIAIINPISGILTGRTVGNTLITYTSALGCITISPIAIRPLPDSIIGRRMLCESDTVVQHDATLGGVWTSSNSLIASVSAGTGIVTGISGGTTQISYSWRGCPTIINLTVNRKPYPITGPHSVCAFGAQIRLADLDTPYGTWSSIYVTVDTLGVVTSFMAGTGIVTYTLRTGCAVTDTLVVDPVPVFIIGPDYLCLHESITYHDATPGGLWSSATTTAYATIDSFSGTAIGVSNGRAIISYTLPSGCFTTKTLAINPLPSLITGPNQLCAGDTTIYYDSLFGGRWLSSSTSIATINSTTGHLSALSGGLDTIQYQYSNRCGTTTVSKTVNIRPQPNAGTIHGPDSVCMRQNITLVDSGGIGLGTWSITNGRANIAPSGTTCIAIGNNPGMDTLIFTTSNVCGTATTTHSIYVRPFPDAGTISGPQSVCQGMAITLTDTLAGGTWVCTNTNASITTTGILTGLNAGLDTIYYNLRTACGLGYVSIVVDIKALPDAGTITGPQQVCVNATITLDNLSKNGHWALTNTHAKNDSNLITGLLAGRDTVKYTVTNSCGSDITILPITINALPNAGTITGLDSICPGDTINSLTDTALGGIWGHSNTSIATLLDSGKLISLLPGIDTITYSVTNTCGTSLATHAIKIRTLLDCDGPPNTQFKVGCSGEGDILIYPNPSRSGEFTFNLFSKYQEEVTITIVNTLGQRITKFDGLTNNYTNIALTLPAGLYIVTAYTPHGKCSEKLVVEVDR